MKVTVVFKSPDSCDCAIEAILNSMEDDDKFTEEFDRQYHKEQLEAKFSRLFEYREYCVVEVDLDTMEKKLLS